MCQQVKKLFKAIPVPLWLLVVSIGLWVLGLWTTHWVSRKLYLASNEVSNLTNAGMLGDSSAVINTLFSALAFAGIIYSIMLQSKELKLQRRELEQTREELESQRHEFESQNDTLRHQRFESTFFNMLHLQLEITNNLNYSRPDTDSPCNGREVFQFFYSQQKYGEESIPGLHVYLELMGSDAYECLDEIQIFDHYFRHLYRIVKYVHTSKLIPEEEKYEYVCILRALLSPFELLILFYNGLCHPKFKILIEEYALLKNTRFDELAKPEQDRALYDSRAYDHPKYPQANI